MSEACGEAPVATTPLTPGGRGLLIGGWTLATVTWLVVLSFYFFWMYVGLVMMPLAVITIFALRVAGRGVSRLVPAPSSDRVTPETLALARYLRPFTASVTALAGWVVCESVLRFLAGEGARKDDPMAALALFCALPLLLSISTVSRATRHGALRTLSYFLGVCLALLLALMIQGVGIFATRSSPGVGAVASVFLGAHLLHAVILTILMTCTPTTD